MKKCPYCGTANDDNAEICVHCYAGFPHDDKQKEKEHKEQDSNRVLRRKTRS